MRRPMVRTRAGAAAILLSLLMLLGAAPATAASTHPLDPLTADELATIARVLKASDRFSPGTAFAWISLDEPDKSVVQAFRAGADIPRRAALTAIDYARHAASAVVVDVRASRIVSVEPLVGVQPGLTDADITRAKAILDADPRVKNALLARGLKVPGKVSEAVRIQYAPIGHDPALAQQDGRLLRAFFASDQKGRNEFSPFLDGLAAVVDLYADQVVAFTDEPGAPAVPVPHDIFDRKIRGGGPAKMHARTHGRTHARTHGTMPHAGAAGRGFTVEGHRILWEDWQLRYGFNLREGLVIYQLAVRDGPRWRPVLYRGSVSEVVTAYGDASKFWSWLELFDEGVFGLGASAATVVPGREVPARARVLDPVLPDPAAPRFAGTPEPRIYVYERAAGSLMYYQQGDLTFHAPATELVIGFLAALGNYTYGFNWILRQDGSFGFEVDLAGEVLTKFVRERVCEACAAMAAGPAADGASRTTAPQGDERYGTLVYPNVVAPNHQHWFNLRLDFDVGGTRNAVMETNLVHPAGSAGRPAGDRPFGASHTVFGRADAAKRDMDDAVARSWTVYNPSSRGPEGRPAGYSIVPMGGAMTVFPPDRETGSASFTFHPFWVTPYRPAQLYAGGRYPNQVRPGYADTLYHYADGAPIYDTDVVVWYSLGMTHFPRPEDYPVMPNAKLAVDFRPDGFFARNPALGRGQVSGP